MKNNIRGLAVWVSDYWWTTYHEVNASISDSNYIRRFAFTIQDDDKLEEVHDQLTSDVLELCAQESDHRSTDSQIIGVRSTAT